jgi:hypothetical protein
MPEAEFSSSHVIPETKNHPPVFNTVCIPEESGREAPNSFNSWNYSHDYCDDPLNDLDNMGDQEEIEEVDIVPETVEFSLPENQSDTCSMQRTVFNGQNNTNTSNVPTVAVQRKDDNICDGDLMYDENLPEECSGAGHDEDGDNANILCNLSETANVSPRNNDVMSRNSPKQDMANVNNDRNSSREMEAASGGADKAGSPHQLACCVTADCDFTTLRAPAVVAHLNYAHLGHSLGQAVVVEGGTGEPLSLFDLFPHVVICRVCKFVRYRKHQVISNIYLIETSSG